MTASIEGYFAVRGLPKMVTMRVQHGKVNKAIIQFLLEKWPQHTAEIASRLRSQFPGRKYQNRTVRQRHLLPLAELGFVKDGNDGWFILPKLDTMMRMTFHDLLPMGAERTPFGQELMRHPQFHDEKLRSLFDRTTLPLGSEFLLKLALVGREQEMWRKIEILFHQENLRVKQTKFKKRGVQPQADAFNLLEEYKRRSLTTETPPDIKDPLLDWVTPRAKPQIQEGSPEICVICGFVHAACTCSNVSRRFHRFTQITFLWEWKSVAFVCHRIRKALFRSGQTKGDR